MKGKLTARHYPRSPDVRSECHPKFDRPLHKSMAEAIHRAAGLL